MVFLAAILLSAFALHQSQAAPTPVEVEVDLTIRIEDHLLPHHTDPRPGFFLASSSGGRPNVIVDTNLGLGGDVCKAKNMLPEESPCGTMFSFGGMDNLHLEQCDEGPFPQVYQGETLYSVCGPAPRIVVRCGDSVLPLIASCFPLKEDSVTAHHIAIRPSENSVAVHHTDPRPSFFIGSSSGGQPNTIISTNLGLGEDLCKSKVMLPEESPCGTMFSFGGMDNLHLEQCDEGPFPQVFQGETLYSVCGPAPRIPVFCPDATVGLIAYCRPVEEDSVTAHHIAIRPSENSVAAHYTDVSQMFFSLASRLGLRHGGL